MTSSELDPEQTQVWEGSFFRQEGLLYWCCFLCGERGEGMFKLVTKKEDIKTTDLDDVACLVEAEHSLRCSGVPEILEICKRKYVERSRRDISFGRDNTPRLFVVSPGDPGNHYEELTIFEPIKEEQT